MNSRPDRIRSHCSGTLSIHALPRRPVMTLTPVDPIMLNPAHNRLPHDSRYTLGAAFSNGTYSPLHEAVMPVLDLGFLQSDVVYEKATVSKGRYFRLED